MSPKPANLELINQLSRIHHQPKKATPIIVVGNRYNLATLPARNIPTDHSQFNLESFRSNINGLIDPQEIARNMCSVESAWVVFNFGQHHKSVCTDFIQKLSHYNYANPGLRDRKLVFIVQDIFLSSLAQTANMSFNNLPTPVQAGQVRRLLMRVRVERILLSLPFLAGIMRRLRSLYLLIYRRVLKTSQGSSNCE